MNGLEALDSVRCALSLCPNHNYKKENNLCNIIEKELKALEIIKRKSTLDFGYIRNADNYDEYLKHFGKVVQELLKSGESVHFAVTKDEFDLLKEVMK